MQRTVTSARSLQGLMKWLTRAEWRDRFAEIYDRHLLPACEQTGLDADEVVEILGESWFMTTVWRCAFEDFLTREGADGRNIVDDYLKRRGWKESASARAYISALRTSVMSLYEVSGIVRDTSFRARDLVRGGDPILISERLATRSLAQWDRIATRVVEVGSQMRISGAVLPCTVRASGPRPEAELPIHRAPRTAAHGPARSALGNSLTRSVLCPSIPHSQTQAHYRPGRFGISVIVSARSRPWPTAAVRSNSRTSHLRSSGHRFNANRMSSGPVPSAEG